MTFSLSGEFGGEFVRAGVRAIARCALAGCREEPDAERADILLRAGADLSDPAAAQWLGRAAPNQRVFDLSATASAKPAASRPSTVVSVQDRETRHRLAAAGIDAPQLPTAALHAWRSLPPQPEPPARRVALSRRTTDFTAALQRLGVETAVDSYDNCAAAITDDADAAAAAAGRGLPAIVIGDSAFVLEELVLPGFARSEADPEAVAATLVALMNSEAEGHRLRALERRVFRTHCDLLRRAAGQPEASAALHELLAGIRHRLTIVPNAHGRWVDAAPLLQLEGEALVREAYRRILGRDPDTDGLRHWTTLLAGGTGKAQCLAALAGSAEGLSRGVRLAGLPPSAEEFIQGLTFGEVAPESLTRWVELIESGRLSHNDAARALAASVDPARLLTAVADLRRDVEWQRRALAALLSSNS
jgi:hypothetical protein